MKAITEYLEVKKPASITIVTLIVRKNSPTPPQECYHAFDIDEEWIVGYGLDDEKGNMRNLPSIWAL
jgi:hypoxanthine-guanine phosphoribosyltransferase